MALHVGTPGRDTGHGLPRVHRRLQQSRHGESGPFVKPGPRRGWARACLAQLAFAHRSIRPVSPAGDEVFFRLCPWPAQQDVRNTNGMALELDQPLHGYSLFIWPAALQAGGLKGDGTDSRDPILGMFIRRG